MTDANQLNEISVGSLTAQDGSDAAVAAEHRSEHVKSGQRVRRPLSIWAWIQAVLSSVVGYGVAWACATAILAFAYSFMGLTRGGLDSAGDPTLWQTSMHLVSAAAFGGIRAGSSSGVGEEVPFEGDSSIAMRVLPVTIVLCVAIFLWTRFSARRYRANLSQTIVLSLVSGASLSATVYVASLASPIEYFDSTGNVISFLYSGGAGAIVGAFYIGLAVSWATWLAYAGIWSQWARRFRLLAHNAARIAVVHMALLTVTCGVIAVVALASGELIEGLVGANAGVAVEGVSVLALVVNLGIYLPIVGSFGVLEGTQTETSTTTDVGGH